MHTPAFRITHFLLTLETVVFLFHLLSTTSKPFSSLSIRLAHAARLGFFYKKTRYINSLLLTMNVNTYTTQQNHVRSRITRGGARIYEIRSPNSVYKAIATGVEKRATAKVARPRRQMPKDVDVDSHGPGCPPPHRLGDRGSVVSSLSSFRAEPRPKTGFGAF